MPGNEITDAFDIAFNIVVGASVATGVVATSVIVALVTGGANARKVLIRASRYKKFLRSHPSFGLGLTPKEKVVAYRLYLLRSSIVRTAPRESARKIETAVNDELKSFWEDTGVGHHAHTQDVAKHEPKMTHKHD